MTNADNNYEANLGLATTKQIIDELAARASVSSTVGEAWPNYRTVDEPVSDAANTALSAAQERIAELEKELIPPTPQSVVIERARERIAELERALSAAWNASAEHRHQYGVAAKDACEAQKQLSAAQDRERRLLEALTRLRDAAKAHGEAMYFGLDDDDGDITDLADDDSTGNEMIAVIDNADAVLAEPQAPEGK